jgi:hypothetical protein
MNESEVAQVSGAVPDAGLPKPEFSEPTASSPSALSPTTIEELLSKLEPVLDDRIDRKFKSTTDKRFSKLEKGTQTMTEVLAALKTQGATIPPDVEREYALRDYVDQRVAQTAPIPSDNGMSQAPAKQDGQFDALSAIKSFGLDTNDAETLNLLKGKYRNPDHFSLEAAKLAIKKAGKPASSSSSLPPLGGGASQQALSDADREVKSAKLQKLYLTPTVNASEIASLKKELGY